MPKITADKDKLTYIAQVRLTSKENREYRKLAHKMGLSSLAALARMALIHFKAKHKY